MVEGVCSGFRSIWRNWRQGLPGVCRGHPGIEEESTVARRSSRGLQGSPGLLRCLLGVSIN